MKIIINDIEFSEEESLFLKKVIEDSLEFWSTAKEDTGEFPWELFEDHTVEINNSALCKLRLANIKTFSL
jgi:hypothetical protein